MMALSVAVGTWDGLQLPAAFQSPVPPIQTRSAAFAPMAANRTATASACHFARLVLKRWLLFLGSGVKVVVFIFELLSWPPDSFAGVGLGSRFKFLLAPCGPRGFRMRAAGGSRYKHRNIGLFPLGRIEATF